LPQRRRFNQVGKRPPFGLGGSDKRFVGFIVQPHGKCFRHDRAPSFVFIMNINECALTVKRHGQRRPNRGLFSCLMLFASHHLFMRAFSTASGFLSITVK
jgi:hypothetical protein